MSPEHRDGGPHPGLCSAGCQSGRASGDLLARSFSDGSLGALSGGGHGKGGSSLFLFPGLSGILHSRSRTTALFVGWGGAAVPYAFLSNMSSSAIGAMNETNATRRDLGGVACQERIRRTHSCKLQAQDCTQQTTCLSGVCVSEAGHPACLTGCLCEGSGHGSRRREGRNCRQYTCGPLHR